jgi:hypothetical protein
MKTKANLLQVVAEVVAALIAINEVLPPFYILILSSLELSLGSLLVIEC